MHKGPVEYMKASAALLVWSGDITANMGYCA